MQWSVLRSVYLLYAFGLKKTKIRKDDFGYIICILQLAFLGSFSRPFWVFTNKLLHNLPFRLRARIWLAIPRPPILTKDFSFALVKSSASDARIWGLQIKASVAA